MIRISSRALARYASDRLLAGEGLVVLAKELAAVLLESGRATSLDFLLGDIAWELERQQALTVGHVTTASPMTKDLEAALKLQLKKATKSREVLLEKQMDKSILGGIKIETSSRVWDLSVSRQLAQLRETT